MKRVLMYYWGFGCEFGVYRAAKNDRHCYPLSDMVNRDLDPVYPCPTILSTPDQL